MNSDFKKRVEERALEEYPISVKWTDGFQASAWDENIPRRRIFIEGAAYADQLWRERVEERGRG